MSRLSECSVRAMTDEDIQAVVRVHLRSFTDFFLSDLGPRFLTRYYSGVLDDDAAITFAAFGPDGVCGFIVGSVEPGGFYSRLLRRSALGFACDAVPAVIRRPSIVPRLLRALRKPQQADRPKGTSTVFSLAVDPDSRRSGVGRRLFQAFESESLARGMHAIVLDTDADSNATTLAFYRDLGLGQVRVYVTPEGRRMFEMSKAVGGASEVPE